jgi:hypothetical protein
MYVYVIAADCKLVKIGCSRYPLRRMIELQALMPKLKRRFLSLVHAEKVPPEAVTGRSMECSARLSSRLSRQRLGKGNRFWRPL